MKIVVLDGYTLNPGDLSWEGLEKLGELTVYERTAPEQIVSRIGDAQIVYTNKTPLTKQTFQACQNIRFVGVLATGYNVVDVAAAKEKNITVSNIPTYGTDAVAQMVFALVLEICHHVENHSQSVKKGEWTNNKDWCYWKHPLVELAGKTMGIVGFGRIGQKVATIAQAFGMKVLAADEYKNPALENENCKYASLDEVLKKSDIVSLHCPLFPNTQNMINKQTLSIMKKTAILINTSRGPLIVEQDLADALNNGDIAAAALDVVCVEPILSTNPLVCAKNIVLTPHISWAPIESRSRLMDIAVNNLAAFLANKPVNIV